MNKRENNNNNSNNNNNNNSNNNNNDQALGNQKYCFICNEDIGELDFILGVNIDYKYFCRDCVGKIQSQFNKAAMKAIRDNLDYGYMMHICGNSTKLLRDQLNELDKFYKERKNMAEAARVLNEDDEQVISDKDDEDYVDRKPKLNRHRKIQRKNTDK